MKDSSDKNDTQRKALLAIKRLQARVAELEEDRFQPIAIIGLSCRYPGAENADEFRDLLMSGRDAIGPVPSSRWDANAYYDPDPDEPGKMYVREGGFLSDIEGFDARLFGISPAEAQFMDPQHRLLLEQTWHALEHARIPPTILKDTNTGVFVGISTCEYSMLLQDALAEPNPLYITGNSLNAAAGRISYSLGLLGPAMSIDTACSSSLVAVHEACQSLLTSESSLAIAAGVNAIVTPKSMMATCRARMLSPDGRCKTFDRDADGYARGEGCGVLILKRLDDALRDGHRILGVLRGTAVNQNGRGSGFTVPSVRAQRNVITAALSAARTQPSQVLYLECHGTGTPLGDPIEVQAASEVYSSGRETEAPLLIASVKTNIGHLESAAGIAGIIKTVIAMQEDRLPQHLNFNTPNPHIAWDALNVRVITDARAWPPGQKIAAVSSFGFSGTNAHAVLAEAPTIPLEEVPAEDLPPERKWHLLTLSARGSEGLRALGKSYTDWFARQTDLSLNDICFSAIHTRALLDDRSSMVFSNRDQMIAQLDALTRGDDISGLFTGSTPRGGEPPKIGFLFTGQGSQYVGMGRDLYACEPVFREVIDRCAVVFDAIRGDDRPFPLLQVMGIDEPAAGVDETFLHQTGYSQPALFAIEVALAALWRQWGIEPYAVLGHSLGEFAAAVIAGVFDVETGIKLIAERARLMQSLPAGGSMAAITGDKKLIEQAVSEDERLCIAAYNGAHLVISGPDEAINTAIENLLAQGLKCKKLKTSHAFHSTLMNPILESFQKHANRFSYHSAKTRFISNVTGEAVKNNTLLDAAYWKEHIQQPVRFSQGIVAVQELGCQVLVEIGPHPVLTTMGQRCERKTTPAQETIWVSSLRRDHDNMKSMLSAAGKLLVTGAPVDLARMDAPWCSGRRFVDLPLYPFQRQPHWAAQARVTSPPAGKVESLTYQVVWEPFDLPPLSSAEKGTKQRWLLIGDRAAEELAEYIREAGHFAECVGESKAVATLPEMNWTHIAHMRAVDKQPAGTLAELTVAQTVGVHDLLELTQHLCSTEWQGKLWVMTRATQQSHPQDAVQPDFAPLWGMGKSIGMEHPEMWGGLIDLPAAGEMREFASLLPALNYSTTEDLLIVRDNGLLIARLIPAAIHSESQTMPVRENGSYLITGGLGGIGLKIADMLAKRGAKHIVLSSRRTPDETIKSNIAKVEKHDCRIEVVSADISSPEAVDNLLGRFSKSQPLVGVVHAAGIEAMTALEHLSRKELDNMLAAKLYGGWLLDQGIRKREIDLDFFIATTSIASVWGSMMQGAYAAANAYLDALIAARGADGLASTAISYGPWAEVGMATTNPEALEWMRSRGITPLCPDLALDAMEMAVANGQTSTTIVDANWNIFRELAEAQRPRPIFTRLGITAGAEESSASETALVKQLHAAQPSEQIRILQESIRTQLSLALGEDASELPLENNFFDLGLDSLMAVAFRNAINKHTGQKFPVQWLYEYTSIASLSEHLLSKLLSDGPPGAAAAVDSNSRIESATAAERDEPVLVRKLGYTVRWYQHGDRAGCISLIRLVQGETAAVTIDKTWEWKYETNPFNISNLPHILVVECGGEIVGMHGGFAGRLKLGAQVHAALWGCDTLVHPDHRRASGLLSIAVDRVQAPLFLGTPATRFYQDILEPGGETSSLETYVRHFGILRLKNILRARCVPRLIAGLASACCAPLIALLWACTRLRRNVDNLHIAPLTAWGPEVDALWQSVSQDYGAIGVRDSAFLTWRFMQCPIHKYAAHGAWRADQLLGYIVTRTGTRNGIQFGIIVELFAARNDLSTISALLRHAVDSFEKDDVDAVECLVATHADTLRTALRRVGLVLSTNDMERIVCQTKDAHAPLIQADNWYCTLADSDLDLLR